MPIPTWSYRNLPAHAAINPVFKAKMEALSAEYADAVSHVMNTCVHKWSEWEHRFKQSCVGGFYRYQRHCELCGRYHEQEKRPDTDEPIKETSDNFNVI